MRDWKVYLPEAGASGTAEPPPQKLVRKRQSALSHPEELTAPQFEIELDMNADQLTLMFDDTVTYGQRSHRGPINSDEDHQQKWLREGLRAKADVAETFGPWSSEDRLDGSTYYRKVTRLR